MISTKGYVYPSAALQYQFSGWHCVKRSSPLLADTLQAAAGVAGKQKWALILPSSARVSLVTYTTVIAVRYPELDNTKWSHLLWKLSLR